MILPTRIQMHRLAPTCQWEEPDYKQEQWKYDTIFLPWDDLILQRQEITPFYSSELSITNIVPSMITKTDHHIVRLIDILYEVGIIVRIAPYCTVTLSLSTIIHEHAIKKIIIIVQEGAHLIWHDTTTFASQKIMCSSLEVHVQQGAQFEYSNKQNLPTYIYLLHAITIFAHANSTVTIQSFAQGARYTKTVVMTYLQGARANIHMQFGGLLADAQHYSLNTHQHHTAPVTISSCRVKYVQRDQARTVYDGQIVIENSGSKSEASQQHQALLMHQGARAYARPILQAKTNDVQCGHGSAIGMLDEEQLWYLQSRGIEKGNAQKILIDAFLQDFFL